MVRMHQRAQILPRLKTFSTKREPCRLTPQMNLPDRCLPIDSQVVDARKLVGYSSTATLGSAWTQVSHYWTVARIGNSKLV